MAESDALEITLTGGYVITAAGIKRDRNGDLAADLMLQNGHVVYFGRGVLNTLPGRAAWAKQATGPNRPSVTEIEDALVRLAPEALSQVQDAGPKPTQADQLVQVVVDQASDFTSDVLQQVELFHNPEGDVYATVPLGDHRETWPIRSKGFKLWMKRLFYEKYDKAPNAQAVQDALGVLEGKALFDGPEHPVAVRIAGYGGAVYIDLCNDRWEAVEIDMHGWRIVASPPVKFRRTRGMLPLPRPVPGGDIGTLRSYLNIETDEAWALALAWLVAALRPIGPYPVLPLHGEQGSAKSTTARILRSLVDPNSAPLRAEPRDARDLVIAGRNGWVLCYDNMSHVPSWLSDALCRVATGGGFATRELYSNDEEVLFDVQRPVILTGIEELATRGDLLDRSIVLSLPSIPDNRRRPEADVWRDFDRDQPRILGALYDAVSAALRNLPSVHLDKLPRLADFALWATAAEPALGLPDGAFIDAYTTNRTDANDLALEASPVAAELLKLIATSGGWDGSPSELLAALDTHAGDGTKRLKTWPKSARSLSGALKRLAPNLRKAGVDVTFDRTSGSNSQRLVTIAKHRGADD